MADGAPLIIEQVDMGQERLAVVLSGSTMPNRGVEAPVEQRIEEEWLPGAKEPNAQVLGFRLRPITFTGTFNDSDAGEGGAATLVSLMTRILMAGVPCVLTWGDVWERRGFVAEFNPAYDLESLASWTLVFKPHAITDPGLDADTTITMGEIEFAEAELGTSSTDATANAGAVRAAQSRAPSSLLGRVP